MDPTRVRQFIRNILNSGTVRFSKHPLEEMARDGLSTVDCTNVLRGGSVEPAELISGTWRYRIRTNRIYVVVAFRSETELVVVTSWSLVN